MSELISGKEALIAMANGEEVEYMDTSNTFKSLGWSNAFGLETNLFFSDRFKFRLKPRTISINGIEVPATFEPGKDDAYWVLNTNIPRGYERKKGFIVCLSWRTEEEIKQVASALRQVFGAKEPVRRMSSDSE